VSRRAHGTGYYAGPDAEGDAGGWTGRQAKAATAEDDKQHPGGSERWQHNYGTIPKQIQAGDGTEPHKLKQVSNHHRN